LLFFYARNFAEGERGVMGKSSSNWLGTGSEEVIENDPLSISVCSLRREVVIEKAVEKTATAQNEREKKYEKEHRERKGSRK